MIGLTIIVTLLLLIVGAFLNFLTRGTIWVFFLITGENLKDNYWNICSIWATFCAVVLLFWKGDNK